MSVEGLAFAFRLFSRDHWKYTHVDFEEETIALETETPGTQVILANGIY